MKAIFSLFALAFCSAHLVFGAVAVYREGNRHVTVTETVTEDVPRPTGRGRPWPRPNDDDHGERDMCPRFHPSKPGNFGDECQTANLLAVDLIRAWGSAPYSEHYYETDAARVQDLLQTWPNYQIEGKVGRLISKKIPGTVPLYHYWRPGFDHVYTSNRDEYERAVTTGALPLDVQGFVFTSKICGAIPLYRLYTNNKDHWMTIDVNEYASWRYRAGTVDLGIVGYVLPNTRA